MKDDLMEQWLKAMGKYDPDKRRNFDDAIEYEFWKKTAPTFTEKNNLNDDTSLIADSILSFVDRGASVLEIGPGSGNFTVLLAQKAGRVFGIDFSEAMLRELRTRAENLHIGNIRSVCGKWEDYPLYERFDYIVSVNSLYRVQDIRGAIHKMNTYSSKGIIIVRTIQRPFFYDLYKKAGAEAKERIDYQLLPQFFYEQGMHADIKFLRYKKKCMFDSMESIMREMQKDLGKEFERVEGLLRQKIASMALPCGEGILVFQPRETVVISYKKEKD